MTATGIIRTCWGYYTTAVRDGPLTMSPYKIVLLTLVPLMLYNTGRGGEGDCCMANGLHEGL